MKRLLLLCLSAFIIQEVTAVTCSPTLIIQTNLNSGSFTISTSGAYQFKQDLNAAGAGTPKGIIIISVSDVDLDLGGFRLIGNASNTTNGIYIKPGLSNINIHGGLIMGMGLSGIAVDGGCSTITFDNVTSQSCNAYGFQLGGITTVNPLTSSAQVTDVNIQQCTSIGCGGLTTSPVIDLGGLYCNNVSNLVGEENVFNVGSSTQSAGVSLNNCSSTRFTQCAANNNSGTTSSKGFALSSSKDNIFEHCKSVGNTAPNAYGFVTAGGSNNRFIQCVAEDVVSNSTGAAVAVGFDIQSGELKSAIIGCTSNSVTAPVGSAIPYGIRTPLNVTSLNSLSDVVNANNQAAINSVAWSPNGQFLAIAGFSVTNIPVGIQVRIYEFDTNLKTLILRTSQTYVGSQLNSIAWSADGQYVATGGNTGFGPEINIYQFDATSKTLNLIALASHNANVSSVSWSDDRFLAIGGNLATDGNEVRVFGFDTSIGQVTLLSSASHGAPVNSVAWSPDNNFVAIGGQTGTNNYHTRVYPWDSVNLVLGAPINPSTDPGAQINTVSWAPDQSVLAVGGFTAPDNNQMRVYSFSGSALTLLSGGNQNVGATVSALSWSPNVQFLSAATQNTSGSKFFTWNGSALSAFAGSVPSHGASVNSIAWSPNGQYVSIGGQVGTGNYEARVFKGNFSIPACLIQNNIISNVTGGSGGIGIQSYSLANLIINNVLYNNDFNIGKLLKTILPVYLQGYAGSPQTFDNILFPPL